MLFYKKKQKNIIPKVICVRCGFELIIESYNKENIRVLECCWCTDDAYKEGYNEAKINYQKQWEEYVKRKERVKEDLERLLSDYVKITKVDKDD